MKSDVTITGNTVQVSRVFDAPRERVFSAWKRPEMVQQWWGCAATTKVECTVDFRAGGRFTYHMEMPGIGEMSYSGVFDEIVEPERIVYHWDFGPSPIVVHVDFEALGQQTRLTVRKEGFPAQELCERVSEGLAESFDKLARVIAAQDRQVLAS